MAKHRWIQKATASIKRRGTAGKCTPISKPGCTGRARALALTFKKIARSRRKAEGGVVGNKISFLMKEGYPQKQAVAIALDMQRRGKLEHGGKIPEWLYDARGKAMRRRMREQMRGGGVINKYPFGGAINKGVTSIATALGAKPENAQLWGSALSTLTGIIPGMQDNLLQGANLLGDVGTVTGQEELQQLGEFTRPVTNIAGMFTGDAGNIFGKVPWKARHGGDPRYAQFHNLPQEEYDKAVINVEKDELEVKGGKVLTDYKAKPRHPEDENEVDFYGNTLAKPGNIIIPRDKREAYLKGDKITRNTIEAQLRRDQSKREREELGELRGRDQYLKSLSENVRRHISATGKTPIEGSSPSIFPPGYGVGLKDLDLYRHGGDINNLSTEDYSNLFYGMGGCVGCGTYEDGGNVLPDFLYQARGKAMRKANPEYFKVGGKVKYQDGSLVEKAPAYTNEFMYENRLNPQLEDYYGKSQAGYNVPQYSPAISTSQTTFDPFYNPGTANFGINKPVQTQGNKFGFSDFAQYAAPAYNIGMGLFGKTPEVENIQNPYTERVKDIMSRRRINMSPVYEGIGMASAGATRQLRGLTGGSAGLQLQGMQNIQNIEARNRANAVMQEQIANMGFRGEEASMLASTLGPQEVAAAERQRQLQYAMEANQAQYLPAGISQLGTIPQYKSRDELLKRLLREKGITV